MLVVCDSKSLYLEKLLVKMNAQENVCKYESKYLVEIVVCRDKMKF